MVLFWDAFKAAICASKLSLSLSLVGACDLIVLVPELDERFLSLAALDFILRESTTVPVRIGWKDGGMNGWIEGCVEIITLSADTQPFTLLSL